MLVIAHRGANREDFENTFPAFEKAIASGAHRIELDVHLTKDNRLVIFHDINLRHHLGKDSSLDQLNYSDIIKIKLPNGERMPFLDEVIERYIDKIELNIEIKGDSPLLAEAVARLVVKNNKIDRFIVSCFSINPLMHIKSHFPQITTACLWGIDTWSWPDFSGCAPNVMMDMCRTHVIHPDAAHVDENFMDQARARQWIVYPWISMNGEEENREGLWSFLKTIGVDGFCTNYPRQLKQWLTEAKEDEERFRINH